MLLNYRCHGCTGQCLGVHIVITINRPLIPIHGLPSQQTIRRHFCSAHCLTSWLPPLP